MNKRQELIDGFCGKDTERIGFRKMEKLCARLNSFQDTYFGFVIGVTSYVKQNPERFKKLMEFLNSSDSLTTSDVVEFIFNQPDFQAFCESTRKAVEEK